MADTASKPSKENTGGANDEEIIDPYCDPENPVQITFQDITAAAFRIKGGVQQTQCIKSHFSNVFGMEIYFKKEYLQYTGSFKERGARNCLLKLPEEQKLLGVIAASAGNHAQSLSYHGLDLNIPVTVVMPVIAPLMKVQNCRKYGASIIIKGANICESRVIAMKIGKEKGMLYINGYDHPDILAGQGTMGLEIIEQVPDVDACIIPVGGGGMIAGTSLAMKTLRPGIKIIGVESERCPSFTAARKAGKPVNIVTTSTIADGLAVPTVGENAFVTANPCIDKMVVVKEEDIALSILRLIELEKAVVEGAGATGLAAVLEGQLSDELKGKKVVIILSGGNIDTTALGRTIDRGLAVDGRLVRFMCTIRDRPKGIAELTTLITDLEVSIKDIFQERAWIKDDIFEVEVKVICETRDKEHSDELHAALKEKYEHLLWGPVRF